MKHMLLAVCIVSSALVGCADEQKAPTKASAPPVSLKVGHVGHDHHLALYVAALEGERFKKNHGIYLKEVKSREVYDLIENGKTHARLRLLKVGGGSRMPAAMSRGEIEIGLGGTTAIAKFADGGSPFKIICPLQTDGDMLVMQKDSTVTDWTSFVAAAREGDRPLRIGYKAPVAVAKMIFERALKAENIICGYDANEGKSQVMLVNFGSEKSPIPLMETKAIDGFVMNQPAVSLAVHKGLGKVVAELRDLPPKGKWFNHPCCCVAATTDTIRKHPEPVKALLKVIILSTQLIRDDQQLAIACASRWTRYDRQVEKDSVPTIAYIAEPTDDWITGMKTWAEMMREVNLFKGKYATATPDEFVADVCDLTMCRQAAGELRRKKLLK